MLRELKNKGFASIVEVIVTSIVFVVATAGIISTISMLRPHTSESSKKIEAAYIAKWALHDLRRQVDALTWGDAGSNLAVGVHNLADVGEYSISYIVTEPVPNLRRLVMNITWPE